MRVGDYVRLIDCPEETSFGIGKVEVNRRYLVRAARDADIGQPRDLSNPHEILLRVSGFGANEEVDLWYPSRWFARICPDAHYS